MKKISLLLFLPFILFSCSRINIVHVAPGVTPSKKQGFYYNLPAAALKIKLQVTKTEYTAGPYRQYAESLLGLKEVVLFDSLQYEIEKVSIVPEMFPDAGQYYFVEVPSRRRCHHKSDLTAELSSLGAVLSVNPPRTHKPIVKKNVVQRNASAGGLDLKDAGMTQNMVERFDTIYENVFIDSLWAQKRTVRRFYTRKTSEERAKEVVEAINNLRKMRINLIGGEGDTPYDEKTIRFMLGQLDSELDEYISLFAGSVVKNTQTYVYTFCPDSSFVGKDNVIWSFSADEGVALGNGEGQKVTLQLKCQKTDALDVFANRKNQLSKKKHGYFYRIPAYTQIVVSLGKNVLCDESLMIPQLGKVASLPLKKTSSRLVFTPEGSLKKVEVK